MRRLSSLALLLPVVLVACRGQVSDKPPIHVIGDMDWQHRYDPQEESPLFEDGRAARPPVAGTIPWGERGARRNADEYLRADDAYYRGRKGERFVDVAPVEVTEALLRRGRERFDIYCSACHDRTGAGRGTVVQRGFPPPVDLTSDRVLHMPDGEVFHVITNGVRNMPAHGAQVPVADRWAIVGWLRVLQRSQRATLDDVPEQLRDRIEPQGSNR